jgi:hypothetical protein
MRNGAVAIALAVLVAGSLGIGYLAGDGSRQTITTTSTALIPTTTTDTVASPDSTAPSPTQTTATYACTTVTIPASPVQCAAPLNYTQFQQYVSESLSLQHQDGAIILNIGYHPCTIWLYVLPNTTQVEIYLGTANATQTCA